MAAHLKQGSLGSLDLALSKDRDGKKTLVPQTTLVKYGAPLVNRRLRSQKFECVVQGSIHNRAVHSGRVYLPHVTFVHNGLSSLGRREAVDPTVLLAETLKDRYEEVQSRFHPPSAGNCIYSPRSSDCVYFPGLDIHGRFCNLMRMATDGSKRAFVGTSQSPIFQITGSGDLLVSRSQTQCSFYSSSTCKPLQSVDVQASHVSVSRHNDALFTADGMLYLWSPRMPERCLSRQWIADPTPQERERFRHTKAERYSASQALVCDPLHLSIVDLRVPKGHLSLVKNDIANAEISPSNFKFVTPLLLNICPESPAVPEWSHCYVTTRDVCWLDSRMPGKNLVSWEHGRSGRNGVGDDLSLNLVQYPSSRDVSRVALFSSEMPFPVTLFSADPSKNNALDEPYSSTLLPRSFPTYIDKRLGLYPTGLNSLRTAHLFGDGSVWMEDLGRGASSIHDTDKEARDAALIDRRPLHPSYHESKNLKSVPVPESSQSEPNSYNWTTVADFIFGKDGNDDAIENHEPRGLEVRSLFSTQRRGREPFAFDVWKVHDPRSQTIHEELVQNELVPPSFSKALQKVSDSSSVYYDPELRGPELRGPELRGTRLHSTEAQSQDAEPNDPTGINTTWDARVEPPEILHNKRANASLSTRLILAEWPVGASPKQYEWLDPFVRRLDRPATRSQLVSTYSEGLPMSQDISSQDYAQWGPSQTSEMSQVATQSQLPALSQDVHPAEDPVSSPKTKEKSKKKKKRRMGF